MTIAERLRGGLLGRWMWTRVPKLSDLERYFHGRIRRLGVFHNVAPLTRDRGCQTVYRTVQPLERRLLASSAWAHKYFVGILWS